MQAIDALLQRRSAKALSAPAPDAAALDLILSSAAAAPDHGRLRPWRFVVIQGNALERFGDRGLCVRRIGQQLLVVRLERGGRRRLQRRLHAAAENQPDTNECQLPRRHHSPLHRRDGRFHVFTHNRIIESVP